MMNVRQLLTRALFLIAFPALALADTATPAATGPSFKDLVNNTIVPIGNSIIGLLYAVAFIAFLVGIVRFFFMGGEEGREKGKTFALWGIIGFVVLFSLWGIVKLLLTTVGLSSSTT